MNPKVRKYIIQCVDKITQVIDTSLDGDDVSYLKHLFGLYLDYQQGNLTNQEFNEKILNLDD